MKRILAAAAAFLMLTGCADTPKTGRGKSDDDDSKAAVTTLSIVPSVEGETAEGDVLYDRCGVTVRAAGFNGSTLTLSFTNSSGREYSPEMLYVEKDGFCDSKDAPYVQSVASGETVTADIDGLEGVGTVKLRMFLNEDYSCVEGSLSDVISVGLNKYITLRSRPLTIPVYEDDRLKISLEEVIYRETNNRVSIKVTARNKTADDLMIVSGSESCVHEDYFASLTGYLPAGAATELTMLALTSNATLSPEQLDSITFTLSAYKAEDYVADPYSDSLKPVFETEEMTLTLPGADRPVTEVPQQLAEAQPLSEFRSEVLDNNDFREFAALYADSCSDENLRLEFCFAAKDTSDTRTRYHFYFKAANLCDKQIKFVPYGIFNGATVGYSCSDSVPAMTEEYIDVRCDLLPETNLGDLTDAELILEVRYDDGHDEDSSRVCFTDTVKLAFANEPYRAPDPDGERMILSGEGVSVYTLGARELYSSRSGLDLFVRNETGGNVYIYISSADDSSPCSFYGYVTAYPGTVTEGTVSVYSDISEAPTAEDIDGTKVTVMAETSDGEVITSGEGVIRCTS